MNVRLILIAVSELGAVSKILVKGLEDLETGGREDNIYKTALLGTARILRVLETCEDFPSVIPQWKGGVPMVKALHCGIVLREF